MKSRGRNGRFTICPASPSRRQSLEKKRIRQRAYIQRRARERKRCSSTFLTAFAVKEQNTAEHWIPGSTKDSMLFTSMESLVADRFVEPRRSRLEIVKRIYFRGDPNWKKARLPRIYVRDACRPEDEKKRVPAFIGWRFPNPVDTAEMNVVESWLKRYEQKLKLGIEDAKRLCFNLFSSYKKRPERCMYLGYPISCIPVVSAPPSNPSNPLDNEQARRDIRSNTDENVRERETPSPDSEQLPIQQDALIKGYKEMMSVATKTDFYYRSLHLILNPSCEVRLDVLCAAWMHQFAERAPTENWCGLLKDIFEYCRLVEQRDLTNPNFAQLREDLANQLCMFKLIRLSAGLPLFEGSSSLIDQVFLRSRSI